MRVKSLASQEGDRVEIDASGFSLTHLALMAPAAEEGDKPAAGGRCDGNLDLSGNQ